MKPATLVPKTAAPVTYIPPLRDGACGTTPRSQQPIWTVVRLELLQMLGMMPTLCWAMLIQRKHVSWADTAAMVVHTMLTCLEMGMMLTAVPLWLMLPGVAFAAWVCVCAGAVMALCWMLNGKEQMHQCATASDGWMMGQETDDEKWVFLGGMGTSSRYCHRQTLPALSRLFGRPITCICLHTYGLPFDMIAVMLQRCIPVPSRARRNLYSQMRCALLNDSLNRCVVLAHNDSAITVSQAVTQLCADVPADKLTKLEIYTFGAAACEFVMPLGDPNSVPEPVHPSNDFPNDNQGIHVEHFAMTNDPFAQMGVLQSVRQNMDGRFCGGVFIMNNSNATATSSPNAARRRRSVPSYSGLTMEEYLTALFPIPMRGGTAIQSGVLDTVMTIDRDCAEKREIAAMSNYHAASQARRGGSSGGDKRLSWTGLGLTNAAATGGHRNGMDTGLAALEMARKRCKNCDGHRGREVTWLVRYINMEMGGAKQVADGVNGMRRSS
ncbi:hypothetical protein MMYC01_205654 [Madurella mycetomatis]|uniref:Uncharacterized protein n=1 Tax=Madurella mycetomatis TaxID=100816 RepID=A0A175VNL4_9PEZI|nr:hypothetical protein MMYC01_210457 [Madurella mycetomatis]KXX78812.1 hypothetical protein MMYC01_205654 [Madurella mycetomatis]